MENKSGFSIKINPNPNGYKSIKSMSWENIPNFSILTGKNGSGKTQLLELLHYFFTKTQPHSTNISVNVHIQGIKIDVDEVGFIPSSGRFTAEAASSIAQMQQSRSSLFQLANQHNGNDPYQMIRSARIKKKLAGRDWQNLTNHGTNSLDENDFESMLVDVDVTSSLATIFLEHRVKMLEALERGTPGTAKDGKSLGQAPWEFINEVLKVAGFPYKVSDPTKVGLLDYYHLKLVNIISNVEIRPGDLSSGEQVLLQLALWVYSSSKKGVFPKLLLLDEPDAHLHPSMTVQFLDVISEVLVKRNNIKVIMTTHSPSTVALAPMEALFQMERGSQIIKKTTDHAELISFLTSGLITVSPATKFCFVEDENDVLFYNSMLEILTDMGPSRDPFAISATPSLVFIAASMGKGTEKISGGKSIVEKWVDKLDAPPLTDNFLGVVDRDIGNSGSQRIKAIGRYSFENYLLDPVNVFGLLIENGNAPYVENISISSGDEHRLRDLTREDLQKIVDIIITKIEEANPSLDRSSKIEVRYTRSSSVMVPNWVIEHRGHDLLQIYQKSWGGHQLINQLRLTKSLKRVRLIPIEMANLFKDLQS